MIKIGYLGMDVHTGNIVLGNMDSKGNFKGNQTFFTSKENIIEAVKSIKAKEMKGDDPKFTPPSL